MRLMMPVPMVPSLLRKTWTTPMPWPSPWRQRRSFSKKTLTPPLPPLLKRSRTSKWPPVSSPRTRFTSSSAPLLLRTSSSTNRSRPMPKPSGRLPRERTSWNAISSLPASHCALISRSALLSSSSSCSTRMCWRKMPSLSGRERDVQTTPPILSTRTSDATCVPRPSRSSIGSWRMIRIPTRINERETTSTRNVDLLRSSCAIHGRRKPGRC
mmetsp:Transcript_9366/g.21793  ORF Transcript_9366/g.21793 Transcript_9366/m.21793 type:complete len:212 (+) Transcript_9366:866-1501(+)